jgi:hypothetical protein
LALHIFFTSDLIIGFPNEVVVRAYMNPEVDDSQEKFSWGQPELDLIRLYPLSIQFSSV